MESVAAEIEWEKAMSQSSRSDLAAKPNAVILNHPKYFLCVRAGISES
jgi:hypothetical protein